MKISMIAAMANNRIIGDNNGMPWHLPADLKHFKATTLGKPVIMGRKTYESIGKALPGRQNIVISRSGFVANDADMASNCDVAIDMAGDVEEVMIIGGGKIYEMFLPVANTLYLTFIHLDVEGDTVFPDWESSDWQSPESQLSGSESSSGWREINREKHLSDDKNPHGYDFVTLERS